MNHLIMLNLLNNNMAPSPDQVNGQRLHNKLETRHLKAKHGSKAQTKAQRRQKDYNSTPAVARNVRKLRW